MSEINLHNKPYLVVSDMAEGLIGSEIIRISAEINEKIKAGETVYNLTIGDFNPKIFPIPVEFRNQIVKAYEQGETNYPPPAGITELREAVAAFTKHSQALDYHPNQYLIACGSRPLIYSFFRAVVDPGDYIIFPVPSWNNNHYVHLSGAKPQIIETRSANNFMPRASEIEPHLSKATVIALCSPLNPTGTSFSKEGFEQICDLIIAENARRPSGQKPLYLLYDQIYCNLISGDTKHYNPVSLRPELADYTVMIDGMSKSFAATGVRVGWAFGPQRIIDKMRTISSHMGSWSPKAEQVAAAAYMADIPQVDKYLSEMNKEVTTRLEKFYKGFMDLKKEGFSVDAITPQGAIYLTVRFAFHGYRTEDGETLVSTRDITKYLLDEAHIGLVPFSAFGSSGESNWYRLSVGTCTVEQIDIIISYIRKALKKLSK